jgi:hypothetical protein
VARVGVAAILVPFSLPARSVKESSRPHLFGLLAGLFLAAGIAFAALARAEQIAGQGGRRIKELRQARMGVVQINPIFGTATSWEGNNDTTSLEKTITSTVSATFSLK